ncbi:MAG: hypothetical protein SYR96_27165 [Actinomycetota bacterium]|nr:hypothetical protein [Actinomycetota bacterium]
MRAEWPDTTSAYVAKLAAARAAFHPHEIRDGWVAVGPDNRPAAAASTGSAVSFRLATGDGARIVDCFLGPPNGELRERCRHLSTLNDLPDEVVVPRWYDTGVTVDDARLPVLVHTEQTGPTLADRLPGLAEAEIEDLLARWVALRDHLDKWFGLRHAGPDPRLVFLPEEGLSAVRVTGWEQPPDTGSGADDLAQALRNRLLQLNPPPVATVVQPIPPPVAVPVRSSRTLVLVMAAVLTVCVAGLVTLWVI